MCTWRNALQRRLDQWSISCLTLHLNRPRLQVALLDRRARPVPRFRSTSDRPRGVACAHRIAADFLGALGQIASVFGYTAPTVEGGGSSGNRVQAVVTYELATGKQAEAEAVVALMHDIVPAPGA